MNERLQPAVLVPYLVWEFTRSNFATFVLPNTAFGVLGALVPAFSMAASQPPSAADILLRLPLVLGFNWYSVLLFDLANQRSDESIQEDRLNKPWRPIPTGKVTQDQTRRALLLLIPIAIWLNYALGVWEYATVFPILSYLYNDLRGSDELVRDLIISVAYAVCNSASLAIAVGGKITPDALMWVAVVSGVILTTMQVQDLKDTAGDRIRGRRTVVLYMGELFSRASIAIFVGFWSLLCPWFWQLGPVAFAIPALSGLNVILRVLFRHTPEEDSTTWKWWCFWTVTLYCLPVLAVSADSSPS